MSNVDIYGFIEPQSIQKSGNKKIDCHTYMMHSDIQKEDFYGSFCKWVIKTCYI